MKDRYDVIVIGGGTAGVVAAIQAARAGAATLLLEKTGMLGGTLTTAAVSFPASFHAWGKQVIAGIGWDLVCKTLAEAGSPMPDPAASRDGAGLLHIGIDRSLFAALADEAVVASGAEILLHAMPAAVARDRALWRLTVCTKIGLTDVRAGVMIDCTGDANVVALCKLPLRRPPVLQPGTLFVAFGGYDAEKTDWVPLQAEFEKAVAAGELKKPDAGWWNGNIHFLLSRYGGNSNHICGIDGTTSEGKTDAELQGRALVLRIYRFLRRQKGFENFHIKFMAPEVGIRETVMIEGEKTITAADFETGRVWEDAVCYSHYGIDEHRPLDTNYRILPTGVCATIPLGAMLPAHSSNLLAAGRCISGDHEANSAYRVEATCMAVGQAAGALAALATARNVEIRKVPLADLHALLRQHGAIVPDGPLTSRP